MAVFDCWITLYCSIFYFLTLHTSNKWENVLQVDGQLLVAICHIYNTYSICIYVCMYLVCSYNCNFPFISAFKYILFLNLSTAASYCASLYCIITIQPNLGKHTYLCTTRDISQAPQQKVSICFIHTQRKDSRQIRQRQWDAIKSIWERHTLMYFSHNYKPCSILLLCVGKKTWIFTKVWSPQQIKTSFFISTLVGPRLCVRGLILWRPYTVVYS